MDSGGAGFVTDTNKTPIIQIVTWFLLASAVLCILCRAFTKWGIIRFVGLDDYLTSAALLFLAGQSTAVTIQTINGLGKPLETLSETQKRIILQSQYAATLLYIPGLCLSKLPTLYLLNLISPLPLFRKLLFAVALLIVGWALSAEFVVAFQCGLPSPWDLRSNHCINQTRFMTYFESMNGFTDVFLIIFPFFIAFRTQTSLRRKFSVLLVFSIRFLEMAVILTKIILYYPRFADPIPILTSWPLIICTQLIQFLSLLSSCILYLRPFLESMSSGFLNGDDLRRRGQIRPFTELTTQPDTLEASRIAILPFAARGARPPPPDPLPDWPLPAGGLSSSTSEEAGVTATQRPPAVEAGSSAQPTVALNGAETRRFKLEQTKEGNYVPPPTPIDLRRRLDREEFDDSNDPNGWHRRAPSESPVGPLQLPDVSRAPIPLGDNGLPRVSQIYTPLSEAAMIQSYIDAKG